MGTSKVCLSCGVESVYGNGHTTNCLLLNSQSFPSVQPYPCNGGGLLPVGYHHFQGSMSGINGYSQIIIVCIYCGVAK